LFEHVPNVVLLGEVDMADVHEVREVRPVAVRRTRPGAFLLTFLLGVICAIALAVAALSIFDIHGTITWPAGRIELGQNVTPHVLIAHQE
jgi:hypothetical protein